MAFSDTLKKAVAQAVVHGEKAAKDLQDRSPELIAQAKAIRGIAAVKGKDFAVHAEEQVKGAVEEFKKNVK